MISEIAVEMCGSRWKRYPAYKDSGVEWIEEVPEHWGETITSALFMDNKKKNKGTQETNLLSLSYGNIIRKDINTNDGLLPETFEAYQIVDSGYIILRLTDLQNDKKSLRVGHVNEKGIITSAYTGLRKKSDAVECPKFFYYLLHTYDIIKVFYGMGAGVRQSLNFNELRKLRLLLPLPEEQSAIAAFLDRETVRIDILIKKKERQIELLQEKRAALISHAVTKGLNPDVKMKDSGVEWIGDIPEHWGVKRLKHVCSLIKDGTHQPPARTSSGIPLLSVRNIINGKFVNLLDDSLISEEDFNKLQLSFDVKKNDVLLAIVGGTIGKVAVVEEMPPFTIQRSLAVLRSNVNVVNYKYFSLFLRSSKFQQLLWKNVGYSAQPGIYLGAIANFNIAVPDMKEQSIITTFLDRETGNIDTLTAKVRESILKLREYRTALISAAVTGIIDVRSEET